jgi:hypothetical protein
MKEDVWIKTVGIYDGLTEEETKRNELMGKTEEVLEEIPCFIKLNDIMEVNESHHKGCITVGLTNGSRFPVKCTMDQFEKILNDYTRHVIAPNGERVGL